MTLEIENVTKRFGKTAAVNDVSLTIHEGEFMALLGPSGSGKTTLLRLIAGLEILESGSIRFDSVDLSVVPARERRIERLPGGARVRGPNQRVGAKCKPRGRGSFHLVFKIWTTLTSSRRGRTTVPRPGNESASRPRCHRAHSPRNPLGSIDNSDGPR